MHFCCCWKFYFLFYEWNNNIDILSVLMCKIVEFYDSHMFMFNVYDYVTTGLYFSLLPRNLVSPPQNVPISGVCLYFTLNKKMCNICSIWQMFCLLLSLSVWCFVASIKESWKLVLHIFVHTVSSSFVDLVLQSILHTGTWVLHIV